MLLFLLSLPIIIKAIKKKHDDIAFINLILYSMFLLQTIYSEDFIQRKYVLIIPTEVCIIFIAYCLVKKNGINLFFNKANKPLPIAYLIICTLLCIGVLLYRTKLIGDGSRLDFVFIDKVVILFVGSFIVLCIAAFTGWTLYGKVKGRQHKIGTILILVISMSVSLYMD